MTKFKEYELESVCDRLSSGKSIKGAEVFDAAQYPVYGGNGLRGYTKMKNFEGDCAIIGRQGAYCGNVRYFSGEAYMTEHAVVVQANKNNNTRYLSYLLSTMNLGRLSGQSAQPGLSVKVLGKQIINLPEKSVQDKIVSVLALLDEKISNNEQINRNLAEQAETIFDDLFGKYLYNQSTLPEKWSFEEIDNLDVLVTDYVANGSFKALADNVQYLSEETRNVLIRLTDFNNNYLSDMVYISDASYEFLSKSKLEGDEIIISNVGANVGTVFRCPRLKKRMSLAPNSIMLKSVLYEHYLYLYFTSAYGQHQLQSIVTGSAQPKFNKTNFRALRVLVPTDDILMKFNEIYKPIHEMIASNNIEISKLSKLRDGLLPKLMFGELDVTDIDI